MTAVADTDAGSAAPFALATRTWAARAASPSPRERQAAMVALDTAAATVAALAAYALHVPRASAMPAPATAAAFAGVWVAALFLVDGYSVERPGCRVVMLTRLLKATPVAAGLSLVIFFARPYDLTRPVLLEAAAAAGAAIALARAASAGFLLHPALATRVVVLASGVLSPSLQKVLKDLEDQYRVVGTLQVTDTAESAAAIRDCIARERAESVVLSTEDLLALPRVVEQVVTIGVRVQTVSELAERHQMRVPLCEVNSGWFVDLPSDELWGRPYPALRRGAEVAVALALGACFLALLPLLALAIKLESQGPVLYRQVRVGRFGRQFHVFKLRTMRQDAERAGTQWTSRNDSRVTRLGRLLRRSRLDEVPQVLNVLRGEMSLIGPRPERPEFVEMLSGSVPHYLTRLAVLPGITGWAQVRCGYAGSISESRQKLEYDLYYVKHRSLSLDLQIAVLTLFTILGFDGR